jgi:hypothetical protein
MRARAASSPPNSSRAPISLARSISAAPVLIASI